MATENGPEKKGLIEKYGAILGVISLILSIATVPATFYFALRADYLSQISSNFDAKIIVLSTSTSFNRISWYYPNGTLISGGMLISNPPNIPTPTVAGGILNISLVVSSPHFAVLNLSDALNAQDNFVVSQKYSYTHGVAGEDAPFWLEPDLMDETMLFYSGIIEPIFNNFVEKGITKIDFSMHIQADFYLNSDYINSLNGTLIGGYNLSMNNLQGNFTSRASWLNFLGSVNISAELQDLQTNSVKTENIPVDIYIPIYVGWS
jgi:hypothetical protein